MLANHLNSPDLIRITEAAKLLDRPVIYTDSDGYERGVLAASSIGLNGEPMFNRQKSQVLLVLVSRLNLLCRRNLVTKLLQTLKVIIPTLVAE